MSTFDKNERVIHDALSQITVDASTLTESVRARLHKEPPHPAPPHRVRWGKAMIAAVVLSAMLVVTVTAATLGGFNWFIEKFNPSFSELVEPIEVSCEEQDIRMEVIGAQKYGNQAVVYLSLQDVSRKNRLTERTDFRDGFSVKMNTQDQGLLGGLSYGHNMLYFDKETNTAYYEFNITADSYSPISNTLELSSFLIYFDIREYENEPVPISLSNIGEGETVSINEDQIWGETGLLDDRSIFTKALIPSHYAALPHKEGDQWISNIGIVEGKLHVQIGRVFHKEFGSSDSNLSLLTPEGTLVESDYSIMLFGDAHRLFSSKEKDYADAAYKYEEFIFPIDTEKLDGYTLCYTGFVTSGVEGNWKVTANLADTSQQMLIWTNETSVEGLRFEYITLSPLGLQLLASYEGERSRADELSVAIETVGESILLDGSGSHDLPERTFNWHWDADKPFDIANVTAVVINDTRIPVK